MFRMIFYITFLPFAIGFEQINRCDVTSGMQLRRECRLLSVSTAVFINVTLSVLGSLHSFVIEMYLISFIFQDL